MSRLPTPGGDDGNWGDILNNFLQVEHNANGTLKKASLITGAEQKSNKGVANGYASLDGNGQVPVGQLPYSPLVVGDYIGVQMYTQDVLAGGGLQPSWDGVTASRGTSLQWSAGDPGTVAITNAGVYAISLTVGWGDSADTSGSSRQTQVSAACGFYTTDFRPSCTDGQDTYQSVQFTAYLQAGDDVSVYLQQFSAGTLTPYVLMLVTRLS